MKFEEVKAKEKYEQAIGYLYHLLAYHDDSIEKVTHLKKKNRAGRVISIVTVFIADSHSNIFPKQFRFVDDQGLWFLNSLSLSFPDLPLEDLSEEKENVQEDSDGT